MLPLYKQLFDEQDSNHQPKLTDSDSAHPGLLFDKYVAGWEHWGRPLGDKTKGTFYAQMTKTAGQIKPLLQSGLDVAIEQRKKMISQLDGTNLELQTDWRLISGLGSAHPYETGFIWHPTLGVPYLPGSGVKGVLRHWVEHWADDGGAAEANRLFGADQSAKTKHQPSSGLVIVFDALPVQPPNLEVDILTPHYQPYYENPQNNPPADYYSPIPVKFLTIASDQAFLFSLALRLGVGSKADLKRCRNYLLEALQTLGAGGKTAVGYGLMKEDVQLARERQQKEADRQAKEEQERSLELAKDAATKSGLPNTLAPMIELAEIENWREDNGKFYPGAEHWLPIITQHEEATARIQAANHLAVYLEQGNNKGILVNPDKTKGKLKKLVFNSRAIQIAKQIKAILGN